ncbi:UNVERIFIED_CONTAM: hypothetical protein K2H54_047252 [Gekko kuhli]
MFPEDELPDHPAYNHSHHQTCMVIEQAFGQLKSSSVASTKWGCQALQPLVVAKCFAICAMLHNIAMHQWPPPPFGGMLEEPWAKDWSPNQLPETAARQDLRGHLKQAQAHIWQQRHPDAGANTWGEQPPGRPLGRGLLQLCQAICSCKEKVPSPCVIAQYPVSHLYGFGLMDAEAMVKEAEKWTTVPPQHVCVENTDRQIKTIRPDSIRNGPDNGVRSIYKATGCADNPNHHVIYLEHVVVRITIMHPRRVSKV